MESMIATGRHLLVGREQALADLEAMALRSPAVLLTGEAGVGKSRLAQAFAEDQQGRGRPVGQAAGLAVLSQTPLAALRPLVGAGPSLQGDLTGWAAERLCDLHPDGVVVVDDVDALDDISAAVLHRLTRLPGERRPPQLVLTLRLGRALPGPLERLLTEGSLEQLHVSPLSAVAVHDYVEQLLDGRVHTPTLEELLARSGGNPLFVRELVLAAWEQRVWERAEDGWRLAGPVATPGRIQSLVDARLRGLPAPVRRLGALLAVAGPLPLEMVTRLDLVAAVGRLEGSGIGRVAGSEVSLSHPLFAEALRLHVDSEEKAELTQRLLDQATRLHLPPGPTVRLAALALGQGARINGAHLVTAARMALSLFDLVTARELADAAAADRDCPPVAALLSAQARALMRDPEGMAGLVELSRSPDPALRLEARLTRARLGIAGPSGPRQALGLLDGAPVSARTESLRAVALMRLNRWREATSAAEEALSLAEASRVEWVDAAGIGALLHTWGGDPARALRLAEHGLAIVDEGVQCGPHVPVVLAQSGSVAGLLAGEPDAADRIAAHHGQDSGESSYFATHRSLRTGVLATYRGHPDAARLLEAATAGLVEGDPVELRVWAHAFWTRALLRVGAVEQAAEAARRGRAVAFPDQIAPQVELRVSEAWLAAALGDLDRALAALGELGDEQAPEVPGSAALVAVDIARLGDLEEATKRLSDAAPRSGSPLLRSAAAMVDAALDVDVAEVTRQAVVLQQQGMHLWAADLLARAARLAGGTGTRAGDMLQARAHVAASACGGPGTPALAGTAAGLTAMQMRVAGLAARGLTNRQVAEALEMSPRTAATHLHRAYAVLDVHDRDELATLFPPGGVR